MSLIYNYILKNTETGEEITIVGGNETAKFLSTNSSKVSMYCNSGKPINGWLITHNEENGMPHKRLMKTNWKIEKPIKDLNVFCVRTVYKISTKLDVNLDLLEKDITELILKKVRNDSTFSGKPLINIQKLANQNSHVMVKNRLFKIDFYLKPVEELSLKNIHEKIEELLNNIDNLVKNASNI